MSNDAPQPIKLCSTVTCPHCWHTFAPEQALWIAEHPDLLGDLRLGADQAQRFLPTRFTPAGAALNTRGIACRGLACPNCHLAMPRALFETPPIFLSIMGGPASGKSYLLAAMTWRLRSVLPRSFHMSFSDADPVANLRLQEYESLQFCSPDQDSLVAIEKTETHGDLYDTVLFGDRNVSFPRPFLFSLAPLESHPNYAAAQRVSRVMCLYDNAGESFLPGQDTQSEPVTRHLVQSQTLLFLFDPTQDLRFQRACAGQTSDPQMRARPHGQQRERSVRQEIILREATLRIRRLKGLSEHARYDRPLIVVVTKYDCWSSLLNDKQLEDPWKSSTRTPMCAVNLQEIDATSQRLRALLWQLTPELVSTAEQFAETVIYIPVSATGRAPEVDPHSGAFGFRPRDIAPMWAEVPVLYSLARWMNNVLPYYRAKSKRAAEAESVMPPPVGGATLSDAMRTNVMPPDAMQPDAPPLYNGAMAPRDDADDDFDGEFLLPGVDGQHSPANGEIEPDVPIAPPPMSNRPHSGQRRGFPVANDGPSPAPPGPPTP